MISPDEFIRNEVLKIERRLFAARFVGTLIGYIVLSVILSRVRQAASIVLLWTLIIIQWALLLSAFVSALGRLRQCRVRHSWLVFFPLILSRINAWELVVLPVFAATMLWVSARNRHVAQEHLHMLPSAAD